jgi:endoribonuclease Dicer
MLEKECLSQNPGLPKVPRLSFFLVTTVPLVFQQVLILLYKSLEMMHFSKAGVIQSNLSVKVGKYCGEMGVDYWDGAKWAQELSSHNVIVCTAKIMENILHLGYITMDKVHSHPNFLLHHLNAFPSD